MTKPGRFAERSLAIFFLGLLLFNPPLLSVFSRDARIGDVPLLYLYLFVAWGILIFLVGRLATQTLPGASRRDRGQGPGADRGDGGGAA